MPVCQVTVRNTPFQVRCPLQCSLSVYLSARLFACVLVYSTSAGPIFELLCPYTSRSEFGCFEDKRTWIRARTPCSRTTIQSQVSLGVFHLKVPPVRFEARLYAIPGPASTAFATAPLVCVNVPQTLVRGSRISVASV